MTEAALDVLNRIRNKTGKYEYVFCHLEGAQEGQPIGDIKKSWKAALLDRVLPKVENKKGPTSLAPKEADTDLREVKIKDVS